jgi:hypothetical protein
MLAGKKGSQERYILLNKKKAPLLKVEIVYFTSKNHLGHCDQVMDVLKQVESDV